MNSHLLTAETKLKYFLRTCFEANGIRWTTTHDNDVEQIIQGIHSAAVESLKPQEPSTKKQPGRPKKK